MSELRENKTIGILNEGKDSQFIGNTFDGLDVGIHDKGEGTVASGNKFTERKQVINAKIRWHQNWWGQLAILVIGGLILAYLVYRFGWN